MTNIMESCVGKILSFLVEPAITHGAYVIQYKNQVQLLEQESKTLGEKKERIEGMVDRATNIGEVIETEVSSWLEKVEQMEGNITNFLNQPEDGESFRCFPGCMCPNLMWRHKRGMEAEERKLVVSELISRGELLQTSPVTRDASFQSELLFDSSQYYTTFQSRASVVDEIRNALKDFGVDMIGVHGPGGAGKTTMVKEVAKEAKELGIFDKLVIAVVSKDPNTSKLQEELASQLDLKSKQISESGRADKLRKALLNGKRKILVILDDLWQVLGLNAIGIPISGLGNRGCKILLTSRNEEVFKKMEVNPLCFPIGYLEEQEAWELFRKVTGDFRVHESTARKVSERCGGLPIAIVAVGAALKGKDEAEWQDALHQLKNCPLKYIEGSEPVDYTPLKWSYDFLKDEDAKSCFLLCCLFPEDAEISIDDLVRYSFALGFLRKVDTLKVARNRVQAMVNMLKRSCLLLKGRNKNFVKMHDVIRDLAISITEEKQIAHGGGHDWAGQQQFIVNHDIKEWPKNDAWEHHTAISLRINNDNISFPRGVLHCPLMHVLVFMHNRKNFWNIIPNDFFQGMKEARVLDIKSMFSEVNHLWRLHQNNCRLLGDLFTIRNLKNLRMLRLNNCRLLGDLSTIRNLKNHIEILSLEGSTIKELPQEIGNLTRLRSLDLRKCESLMMIPKDMISNLIHLEELYVTRSFKNWDTTTDGGMNNASIGELKSLNQLTVLYVRISANSYTIMVQNCRHLFETLINFAIFINIDIWLGNESPNVLEIVNFYGTHDESCLLMDRVETLRLQNLETLHVRECRSLTLLVDEDLKPNIQSPTVKFKLTDVFSKLRDLYLDDLPKLMKIWFNDEDYHSNDNYVHLYLRTISIRLCHSLTHAFSAFIARHLACIEELRVNMCSGMEVIVSEGKGEGVIDDGIIEFCQLETLELYSLPNLKSFYESKSEASHLFNHQVTFPKIKYVTLGHLESSREIQLWDLLTTTQEHLHRVKICRCQVSTKVSSHHQKQSSRMIVDSLFLDGCWELKHVIDLNGTISIGEEQFVDVKRLTLCFLYELVLLWNMNFHEIWGFRSLKEILIKKCCQLRSLFTHSMATTLQHLKMLSVISCDMIEEIIIIEENNINFAENEKATRHIEFPKLKMLFLEDLPNLKNFCNDEKCSFSFSSLHYIVVKQCPEMKTFASGQICLPSRMIQAWVEYEEVEITDLNAFFESRNEDNNRVKITINRRDDSDEGEYDSDVNSSSEDDYDVDIARLFPFSSLRDIQRIHFPPIRYLEEEPEA